MARVTATEVKGIIETTLTDAQVDVFITSANVMVDDVLGTAATNKNKEIERWLTAHMIAITKERQAKKEEAGGAKVEYAGYFGEGLKGTSYGQMVLSLDTSGAFAGLGGRSVSVYTIPQF